MDLEQFWTLVSDSHLFPPEQLSTIRLQFETENLGEDSSNPPNSASKWLVEKRLISPYQAEILTAGHPGPFIYGNYTVEKRIDDPLRPNSFYSVHRASGHPVLLQFHPGNSQSDLEVWQDIEALAERARSADSPSLLPVFEPVVLPRYRLVAMGRPPGQTLATRLPRKSRLPWQDACVVFAQIARGLHELHENRIVHNAISPRVIWLHKSGLAQIQLAIFPDRTFESPDISVKHSESSLDYMAPEAYVETTVEQPQLSRQSDLYSLGCTIFRAIAGKVVFEEADIPKKRRMHKISELGDLSKFELPKDFESLLRKLLAKKPEARPTNALVVAELLQSMAGEKFKLKSIPGITPEVTPSLAKIRNCIGQFEPSDSQVDSISVQVEAPEPNYETNTSTRIEEAKRQAAKRKNSRWMLPVAIGGSLLVVASIVAIAFMYGNQPVRSASSSGQPNQSEIKQADNDPDAVEATGTTAKPLRFVQDLINDDRSTLWESPTDRAPMAFSYFPSAPKLLFTLRAQAFLETSEGPRIVKSLGPGFRKLLDEWEKLAGLPLEDIQRVTVSLHTNEKLQYDFFYQVQLPQPTDKTRLLQIWKEPQPTSLESGEEIYVAQNNRVFHFLPMGDKSKCQTFVLGRREHVEEIIKARGFTGWSGTTKRLTDTFDRDQHFVFLFLRPALFNDEGQWLMSGQLAEFNRQLSLRMDDQIRGGMIGLHLDEGAYTEFILDRNSALKASDLKSRVDEQFRRARGDITSFFAAAPNVPFWESARVKAPVMFSNVYQNLRLGVEYGEVTGNCWLPPMAVHNLIAVAEMATSFSSGVNQVAEVNDSSRPSVPQSISELLDRPRDLTVNTNPDMNILLESIRQEVIDDYGELPFEFNIRLLGNDLSKEGITQNQRPSDFEVKQTSLSEILTQIMVRCNPKKDISGASDPECKLVWVVGDDPNSPGNQAILITTRSAAQANGYKLPNAFQVEPIED